MIFLTMVYQILGGIENQARAKLTIIRYQGVKLPNMFHPQFTAPEIPVTLLTFYLVLTIPFYLTNSWMPLVGERVQLWCADDLHRFLQLRVGDFGDYDVGLHVWLDCGHAVCMFTLLAWMSCRMVVYMVSTNKGSETNPAKHMSQK